MWFKVIFVFFCMSSISAAMKDKVKLNQNDKNIDRSVTQNVGNKTTQQLIREEDDYVPFNGKLDEYFDWKLISIMMKKNQSNNVLLSPFSVKLLLILLSEATDTNLTDTKLELLQAFSHFSTRPYSGRRFYKKIFNSLMQPSTAYDFKMGTKIFIDDFIEPHPRYKIILQKYYYSDIERISFKQSKQSSSIINDWCSNITNGKIKNVVQQDDLESSVMIMLNAIYFQGQWLYPFSIEDTVESPFLISSSKLTKANFMSQTGLFYYHESLDLKAQVLRLPYKGQKFSMLVFLPNSVEGLNEMLNNLNGDLLRSIEWKLTQVELRVFIPKFKYEYLSNMNDALKEIGIKKIFTTEASLPLLARGSGLQHQLQVSSVIQQAGFQVDETGSTAFVATKISLINRFGGGLEFNANHPFLFLIQDDTTGTILFVGKVINPAE